jgi:hypothetical protein
MKRIFPIAFGFAVLLALGAWMVPMAPTQASLNVANFHHDTIAQAPAVYVNTPDTSSSLSMGGYVGAGIFAQTGVVDNAANPGYLVYQDSSGAASWTTRDSVLVDTTDNASLKLHIVPRGPNMQLRTIFRGAGAAADTVFMSVTVLFACQRVPC